MTEDQHIRDRIIELLKLFPRGLKSREIALMLKRNVGTIRQILKRMNKRGTLKTELVNVWQWRNNHK